MLSRLLRVAVVGMAAWGLTTLSGCEGRVTKPTNNPKPTNTAGNNRTVQKEEPETGAGPMLTVQSEPFGNTEDGQEITQYSLTNAGGMKVGLINFGGIVTSCEVPDRDGKRANVTLNFPDAASYLVNGSYFGGICGRYANRIAKGKFTLEGTEYELFVNNGPNHLHGGKVSFIKKLWKGETFKSNDKVGVKFSYTSPDGEEGYPGKLKTIVTYTLTNNNELQIDYEATTDKPTVLNLTNHCYWNLAGAANGNVHDHELTLFCSKYLPVDETSIPTGEVAPVEGTCMDFTKPTKIGARIEEPVNGGGGYDHCYVVDGTAGELRLAAKVVDPASGRVMEIETTEPAIQFYTGNHLAGQPDQGNAVKHGAFCLETQHYPDSPNRPEFPSTRLNPGEKYTHTTIHRFSVAK